MMDVPHPIAANKYFFWLGIMTARLSAGLDPLRFVYFRLIHG